MTKHLFIHEHDGQAHAEYMIRFLPNFAKAFDPAAVDHCFVFMPTLKRGCYVPRQRVIDELSTLKAVDVRGVLEALRQGPLPNGSDFVLAAILTETASLLPLRLEVLTNFEDLKATMKAMLEVTSEGGDA